MRRFLGVSLVLTCSVLPHAFAERELTFEERVVAREAIERVNYTHRVGTSRPFEIAVPRELLERKVRDTLALGVALGAG